MLQTERLILRQPGASDLKHWQPFFVSDRALFIGGGPGQDEGRGWRAFAAKIGHWELNGCGPFVMELRDTGQPIGSVGPWYPAGWPEKELSWSVWSPAHEGSGYAVEAVRRVRAHVFDDLGWTTAVSYVAQENTRSIALSERLGCARDMDAAVPDGWTTFVYRHSNEAG